MESLCPLHPDCILKYYCVEPSCKAGNRIGCAECQIEGPHKKHDFKSIPQFKSSMCYLSTFCLSFIKERLDYNRAVIQIKEEIEQMRFKALDVISRAEKLFLEKVSVLIKINPQEAVSKSTEKLSNLEKDCKNDGIDFLQHYDPSFLIDLYQQREKLFLNEISSLGSPMSDLQKQKTMLSNILEQWLHNQSGISSNLSNLQPEILFEQTEKEGTIAPSESPYSSTCVIEEGESFIGRGMPAMLDIMINQDSGSQYSQFGRHLPDIVISKEEKQFQVSSFQRKIVKKADTQENIKILVGFDDKRFLTASSDNIIRICDKQSMVVEKEFRGHNWQISGIIPFDSSFIISSSQDTTIKIWRISDQKQVISIRPHALFEVTAILLFGRDTLISAGKDCSIFFHSIIKQKSIEENDTYQSDSQNSQISHVNKPTNYSLFLQAKGSIDRLMFPARVLEKITEQLFAVGYFTGEIELFNFEKRQCILTFENCHEQALYSLTRVDATHFCSSGGDQKIKLWSTLTCYPVAEYKGSDKEAYIKTVKVIKEGQLVGFASNNSISVLSCLSDTLLPPDQRAPSPNSLVQLFSLSVSKPAEITEFSLVSSADSVYLAIATSKSEMLYYA